MEYKAILLDNSNKIHTTKLGIDRIKKNLKLDTNEVVKFCVDEINKKDCKVTRKGKNYYCNTSDYTIVINAYSYTIITAHLFNSEKNNL